MYDLPLFPLNTVLFPGMPIHLHIFEERYKQMMQLCISEGRPFGVVLIESGQEVGTPAEPQSIGCTAQIAQLQPLDDGRMNLIAIGQERFEIQSLSYDKPYLMGMVEELTLAETNTAELTLLVGRLTEQLIEYLELLSTIGQTEFEVQHLPENTVELAYLAATLLQIPMTKKQEILVLNDSADLLKAVYQTCRQELAVLKAMVATTPQDTQTIGPFSLN